MDDYSFPDIAKSTGLSGLSNIQKIELAEYFMIRDGGDNKIELPLTHHINSGIYAREIFLPKNTMLTGKVHNFDHLSTISKGEVSIYTEEGLTRIKAPFTWHSKAGVKRLIFVHEDTIWTTYHATNITDVATLEKELVHDSDLSWIEDLKLLSGDNNDICSNSSGSGGGGSFGGGDHGVVVIPIQCNKKSIGRNNSS